MRIARSTLIILAACHVPAKEVPADAPADTPDDTPIVTTNIETILDDSPSDFSNMSQAVFRFHSNVASALFECRFDQEPTTMCTSPLVRMFSDGMHTLSVRAIDESGDSDDTPAERVWTIDTVAPDTMLTRVPPLADNSVTAEFAFTSNEMNVTFECSLDNASYVTCSSPDVVGPIGDGPHAFAVRARDRAGNADASPAIYAWRIDTSTPDTVIASGPQGSVAATTATFTFYSPDAGGGATFQCSLDSGSFVACSSPQTYSNLAERTHVFAVRVRDAVGNVDPTPATRNWTVDLTPPTTTITAGPSGMVAIASASFSFISNEAGATFSCSLDGSPFAACVSPASYVNLAQGSHTFAVRATDAAGHDDPSPAMRTWMIDTVAPTLTITMGPAGGSTSGPRVVFVFTLSDGNATCAFDAASAAPCTSPVAINLPAGPHQFAVTATDAAGNATTAMRSWTVACAAPDSTGAAGLLHLDDTGQTQTNAVAGGAPAVLGDTTMVEPDDPAPIANGRFGGALAFTGAESDHVMWPVMLAAMADVTIELWVRPNAAAGAHEIVVTGDGRLAIDVTAQSPSMVVISVVFAQSGGPTVSATSAAITAGAWHHVLASLRDPALRLWVDGVRSEVDNVRSGMPPALDSIRLGGAGGTAYTGSLDEVWLAQTAITTDDGALQRYCPVQ